MRGDKLVTGRHYAAPRQFGRVVKPTVGLCRSKSFPLTRVFSFVETVLPRPTQMGERVMREVVAKRIMEMAERGVQDREVLVTDAIRFIAANYQQPSTLAK